MYIDVKEGIEKKGIFAKSSALKVSDRVHPSIVLAKRSMLGFWHRIYLLTVFAKI